jgi:hypothetical protein
MKTVKIVAGLTIAGGLAAGAVGIGAGVASADPGLGPVPTDWRPGPPPPWQNGPGWGGPGPGGWTPPPWQGGPIPGGWNGGWEPTGGICLFNLCV